MELMKIEDLEKYFGTTKRTISRWVHTQEFPKPIKLSAKICVWERADVIAWVKGKKRVDCENK